MAAAMGICPSALAMPAQLGGTGRNRALKVPSFPGIPEEVWAHEEPSLTRIPKHSLTPRPQSIRAVQHFHARSRSLVRARASFASLTSSAIS